MLNFKEYGAWLDWSSVSLGGGFLVVSKKEASSKEDLVGKSNLCRRPFCPSLWLCGRGSAAEIALQSVTTLSNHQCIHNEGFHLKLCEPHFIQNGGGKKGCSAFFLPVLFSLSCCLWKSLSRYNQRIQRGTFFISVLLFSLVPRMNEKHDYTGSIKEALFALGVPVMIS